MKNLIVLIFLTFTFSLFSQTRLDTLVLKEVNDYRDSLKLSPVTFSKDCFQISEKHTKKLIQTKDSIYHSDNFIGAEVVNYVTVKVDIKEKYPDVILAKEIVNSWKSSKKHNEILISNKYKYAGSSSMISRTFTGFNGKMIKTYLVFSTLNFK